MNSAKYRRFYWFGPFCLDVAEKLLLCDGRPVMLTVKDFETLLVLVQNGGRLLEKDEFLKRVWPDTIVEENNLAKHISTLRQALGENKNEHKYIETVPRRGYRFVCPVSEVEAGKTFEMDKAIRNPESLRMEETPDTTRDQNLIAKVSLRKQRASLILTVISLTVVAIAGAAYKYLRVTGAEMFPEMRIMRLPNTDKSILAAISPDGKFIAHVTSDGERQSLWLRQTNSATDIQILSPEKGANYIGLTFSHDGAYLYYVGAAWDSVTYSLYRAPVLGGEPKKIIEDVDSPVTLAPDDKRLAFRRCYPQRKETAIIVANIDGTGEYALASRKSEILAPFGFPSWSPKGNVIACPVLLDNSRMEVAVFRVDGKTEEALTSGEWDVIPEVKWLADGSGIILTGRNGSSSPYQIWNLSYPGGSIRRVTNDINNYYGLDVSAGSENMVAARSERRSGVWIATDGDVADMRQITSGAGEHDGDGGISWTPDGKIVYTSRAGGHSDIWIMTAEGEERKQLTMGAGENRNPQVAPDGRRIVMESSRAGKWNIWRIDIDGGNPKQLTKGEGEQLPHFSSDGKWVYFSTLSYLKPVVGKTAIEGGDVEHMPGVASSMPAVSPEGNLLSYPYVEGVGQPKWKAAVIPATGGTALKIFELALQPAPLSKIQWSNDGKSLLYVNTRGGVSNVWMQPLGGASLKQLTGFNSDRIWSFAQSRDGKQLAVARGPVIRDLVLISYFR